MQISLVILAAGFGTRFKNGSKQEAIVGPNGEWILDYSIKDAIDIGFNEIIFVIRKDMKNFEEAIIKKYQNRIKFTFVYQDISDIPISIDFKREKPWGTAHAIYATRNYLKNNFCVIHADDYYGKDALTKMYYFLKNNCNDYNYAMVAYSLLSTLQEGKKVNRAICNVKNNFLMNIEEILGISKNEVVEDKICSMGLFGFSKSIFNYLETFFKEFLNNNLENKEFMVPDVIQKLIGNGIKINVLNTNSKWIGMTYYEDLENIRDFFNSDFK